MSNQRNRWLPGALLGIALGATGCTGKLTPQQAAPSLRRASKRTGRGAISSAKTVSAVGNTSAMCAS
jgi:hypothetical protein